MRPFCVKKYVDNLLLKYSYTGDIIQMVILRNSRDMHFFSDFGHKYVFFSQKRNKLLFFFHVFIPILTNDCFGKIQFSHSLFPFVGSVSKQNSGFVALITIVLNVRGSKC